MEDTKMRDEFEKEANEARFFPREISFAMTKSPSGRDEYANSHLQARWEGWQAAWNRRPLSTQAAEPVGAPSGDPSRTVDRIAVCYPWGDLTAELVRDGAQRNWILRKGGSNIRHLNQYENNYVNSAIAATTAAMQRGEGERA